MLDPGGRLRVDALSLSGRVERVGRRTGGERHCRRGWQHARGGDGRGGGLVAVDNCRSGGGGGDVVGVGRAFGFGRTSAVATTREGAPGGGVSHPDFHPTGLCCKPESEPRGQKDSGCNIAGQAGSETEGHLGAVGGQGESGRSGGGFGGAGGASVAAGSAALSHNRLQELLEVGGWIVRKG